MKNKLICTSALGAVAAASPATASVTYVDATPANTSAYNESAYPGNSWFVTSTSGSDSLWTRRSFGNGGSILESNGQNSSGNEDAPGLVLRILSLAPGAKYEIHGFFWSPIVNNNNWRIKGSLSVPPPLANHPSVSFSRAGSATSTNTPALAVGVDGTSNLGVTYTGTGSLSSRNAAWTSTSYFTTDILIGDGNRTLYQATFGQTTADATGTIRVFIDDQQNTDFYNRTFFDGVGFELIPEPSPAALVGLATLGVALRRRRS